MAVETQEVLADVKAGKYEPWICLDTYLMAHLAELLTKMRDEGHSHPARYTDKEWRETLSNLIHAFENYDVDNPDAYKLAQRSLRYMADNLATFWD